MLGESDRMVQVEGQAERKPVAVSLWKLGTLSTDMFQVSRTALNLLCA